MNDEADRQVDAFLKIIQERTGRTEEELYAVVHQLVDFQERTARYRRYAEHAARTFISLVVVGLVTLIGYGIYHMAEAMIKTL